MVSWRAITAVAVSAMLGACSGGADELAVAESAVVEPAATPAPETPVPAITAVREPATVTTPADRVDEPLTVHWIGGSDVVWDEYSLPDQLLVEMPSFGERPIVMRTTIVQAVMPVGMRELLEDAVTAGADAIVMSVNPVWLHWDGAACLGEPLAPHEFYRCLLTPVSSAVTAQRADELQALFGAAAAAGVPVYAYTQPHSIDVLSNTSVAPAIEAAEASLAAFDPQVALVQFRSRVYTRDTAPMREGVEFFDMVHPTPSGAAVLTDWLAGDLATFWRSAGVATSLTS